MIDATPPRTRERIVSESARLFSTKGYQATTVADIQLACGLTGGSGALYKHFPSKRALLDEVMHTHVNTMKAGRRSFSEGGPPDPRDALRQAAHQVWAGIEQDQQVVRVMLRDLEEFPDLLERSWDEVRSNTYDEFTHWLCTQQDLGNIQVADPAATAAVLLASLTFYPILRALIGKTPGDATRDAFTSAWVEHAIASLGITDTKHHGGALPE